MESMEPREEHDEKRDEAMICTSCAAPNDPRADFCNKCGAPIGALTMYDPLKHIHGFGWAVSQAGRSRKPRFIVLLGIWLIFGPASLGIGAWLTGIMMSPWRFPGGDAKSIFNVFFVVLFWCIYLGILWKVTRNFWGRRRFKAGSCLDCGYDLTGLSEYRCPECGCEVDPEEHAVELPHPDRNRVTRTHQMKLFFLGGARYLLVVLAAITASIFVSSYLQVSSDDRWIVNVVYLCVVLIPIEFLGISRIISTTKPVGAGHVAGVLLHSIHLVTVLSKLLPSG